MRLSVSAARTGELVINIVLTTAASVKGNMVFIFISFVYCLLFLTLEARYILREIFAMGFNPTGICEMFPEIPPGHLVPF